MENCNKSPIDNNFNTITISQPRVKSKLIGIQRMQDLVWLSVLYVLIYKNKFS